MLNYAVDRALLEPLVPTGTMLDTYKGVAYVSMVGFLFLQTRVLGVPIPWHRDFEEVNLRFYVRRFSGEEWRRGVVFIKEIVPKPAIATIARPFYEGKYVSLPMAHFIRLPSADPEAGGTQTVVDYSWKQGENWSHLRAIASELSPTLPAPGSLEEFITEHYWGYVRQRRGHTVEYQVEHPRWDIQKAQSTELTGDLRQLYGDAFGEALAQPPRSAFLASGSPVTVYRGNVLSV